MCSRRVTRMFLQRPQPSGKRGPFTFDRPIGKRVQFRYPEFLQSKCTRNSHPMFSHFIYGKTRREGYPPRLVGVTVSFFQVFQRLWLQGGFFDGIPFVRYYFCHGHGRANDGNISAFLSFFPLRRTSVPSRRIVIAFEARLSISSTHQKLCVRIDRRWDVGRNILTRLTRVPLVRFVRNDDDIRWRSGLLWRYRRRMLDGWWGRENMVFHQLFRYLLVRIRGHFFETKNFFLHHLSKATPLKRTLTGKRSCSTISLLRVMY